MKTVLLLLLFTTAVFAAGLERDEASQSVTDKTHALVWQDDTTSASIKSSYKSAMAYCKNFRSDGSKDWRLPSVQELNTILDGGRTPTISQVFKHAASDGYWAKSEDSGSVVWVDFSDGATYKGPGMDRYLFVRCVRNKNKL